MVICTISERKKIYIYIYMCVRARARACVRACVCVCVCVCGIVMRAQVLELMEGYIQGPKIYYNDAICHTHSVNDSLIQSL